MTDTNVSINNTPPGVQTADNTNKVSTFDSSYDDLANKVAKNKNSPDNSERAYRIAGIIDLKTGTTKDMIYQVDLGEAEKVAKKNRDNTFYGTNGIDVPDYSALATPVTFQSKKTMFATIADTASSTGKIIKEGSKYLGNKVVNAFNYKIDSTATVNEIERKYINYIKANNINLDTSEGLTQFIKEGIYTTNTNGNTEANKEDQYNYILAKYKNIDGVPDDLKDLYEEAFDEYKNSNVEQLVNTGGGRRHKTRRSNKTKNRKFYSNKTKRSNKRSNKTRKSKA